MAVLSEQSASGALETNSITFAFFPEGEQYASPGTSRGNSQKTNSDADLPGADRFTWPELCSVHLERQALAFDRIRNSSAWLSLICEKDEPSVELVPQAFSQGRSKRPVQPTCDGLAHNALEIVTLEPGKVLGEHIHALS